MAGLTRTPPKAVRQELCREVGFRCPVDDCGSPYLTFHHFDPPWRDKEHHNPAGMVALCSNHAAKADGGQFPNEYFTKLKREGRGRAKLVEGKFDYLRRELLALIGSNFYYGVETILEIGGQRCVFFNRDEDGYLLLNFQMPGLDGEPRAWLQDNVWRVPPGAADIECPPRGRFLAVRFKNGDSFRVEFTEVLTKAEFEKKFPKTGRLKDDVRFPLTIAEFWENVRYPSISFGTSKTTLPGNSTVANNVFVNSKVAISLGSAGLISPATFDILKKATASQARSRNLPPDRP